jgi:phosphoribosyl-ATP pyrophosphohydrolase/phosphoribosyl-AMP cyclohydrolase
MLQFKDNGLMPVVIQDDDSGEVLTLAYMNDEALRRTLESGQVWFYSRSRQELWHKGATSGNFLNVRRILIDCDDDALLIRVQPLGPACHTGERTCFHRDLDRPHSS